VRGTQQGFCNPNVCHFEHDQCTTNSDCYAERFFCSEERSQCTRWGTSDGEPCRYNADDDSYACNSGLLCVSENNGEEMRCKRVTNVVFGVVLAVAGLCAACSVGIYALCNTLRMRRQRRLKFVQQQAHVSTQRYAAYLQQLRANNPGMALPQPRVLWLRCVSFRCQRSFLVPPQSQRANAAIACPWCLAFARVPPGALLVPAAVVMPSQVVQPHQQPQQQAQQQAQQQSQQQMPQYQPQWQQPQHQQQQQQYVNSSAPPPAAAAVRQVAFAAACQQAPPHDFKEEEKEGDDNTSLLAASSPSSSSSLYPSV
jgi:hypothetical protein